MASYWLDIRVAEDLLYAISGTSYTLSFDLIVGRFKNVTCLDIQR